MSANKKSDAAARFPALRITDEQRSEIEDLIVREYPLTISLNNQELVTLLCSPTDLKYLAVGFLFSEGLVKDKEEITKIVADEGRGIVWVETREDKGADSELVFKRFITTGCGRGASFYSATDLQGQSRVESQLEVSPGQIFALVDQFQHYSELYKATHGTHSAALCDTGSILLFRDDIGRHNAVDKVFGECILKDIPTDKRMMILSGRISSEMLLKVAKRNVPVLISISAPTDLGVKLANELGVTLIGFVRAKRMNVYSGSWRIAEP